MHRKTQSAPRPGATVLLALVFAVLLFLNNLHLKAREQVSSSITIFDDTTRLELSEEGLDSSNGNEVRIQISGYWKEVRASLGLSPLPDIVAISASPSSSVTPSGDNNSKKGIVRFNGHKIHRQRIGRLRPALLRRWESVNDRDLQLSGDLDKAVQKLGAVIHHDDGVLKEMFDEVLEARSEAVDNSDGDPASPVPFLAADTADSTSRLSSRAHAAAFRAIAARELRMKTHEIARKSHRGS